MKKSNIILLAFLLLAFAVQLQAQHLLRLSNIHHPARIITIKSGTRVGCVLRRSAKGKYKTQGYVGVVRKITPDSITIEKTSIGVVDIEKIGKRMRGTTFFSALLTAAGVGLVKSGTTETTPCSTCQTVNSDTSGGNTVSVIAGLGAVGLGVLIIVKIPRV